MSTVVVIHLCLGQATTLHRYCEMLLQQKSNKRNVETSSTEAHVGHRSTLTEQCKSEALQFSPGQQV